MNDEYAKRWEAKAPSKVKDFLALHELEYPSCGFFIRDGWMPFVEEAMVAMKEAGWKGELFQVKEKFGGLRIYVSDHTPEVDQLIAEAERKSFETCEVCGNPGDLRGGGWLKTLCGEHAEGKEPVGNK
jgi:hypothetical protein